MVVRRSTITKIGIFLFLFFTLTVDFRLFIFKNRYVAYIFAIISLIMMMYGSKFKFNHKQNPTLLIWYLAGLFVYTSKSLGEIIGFLIGLILLTYYTKTGGLGEYTVKILMLFGFVYSFFTFFFYFFPDLYNNSIVPMFTEYAGSMAKNMLKTGSYPGLTAHYSTNGTYLAIGLGATFSCLLSLNRNKERGVKIKVIYILLIIIIGALLLTGKRAHLVFAIASSFLIYWINNVNQKKKRFLKLIGIMIGAIVIFTIAVNQIPALSNTFRRFLETSESGNVLMGRDVFYSASIMQFFKSPIFGIGWRQMFTIIGHDSHNIYIQLLAETGIVGFSIYTGLLIYGIVLGTQLLYKNSKNKSFINRNLYCILIFSVYYMYFFVVYGLTGNPLFDEQPFYILMISFGSILYIKKLQI